MDHDLVVTYPGTTPDEFLLASRRRARISHQHSILGAAQPLPETNACEWCFVIVLRFARENKSGSAPESADVHQPTHRRK
jgi:hypothetical protein